METTIGTILILTLITIVILAWNVVNWLWLRPKRLERVLRDQGFEGNPYTLYFGDNKEDEKMRKEISSKPMNFSHDILPRVSPFAHHCVNKYGKNCFMWSGPIPTVILSDTEIIKDVLNKIYSFKKSFINPHVRLLVSGVASYEGEKWAKHRKLINPSFNIERLKNMLPLFTKCCDDLISDWEGMFALGGSCEIDVWPPLQNFASDVISRTSFGSSYEEGKRIFQLLKELTKLTQKILLEVYIPGWRFVPTTTHRRMKEIDRDVRASLKDMINKREKALKEGQVTKDNLLDKLLESNHNQIQEQGNNKNVGMNIEDVIEECKLLHFAGQETTATLLTWTMILLSRYPEWQERARDEVFQVFGNRKPDFDGLNQLKIVTMILYEVLRLYPPVVGLSRKVDKDVKLGNLSLPAGVQLSLPIIFLHHDSELWGVDAKEFKPERFSEGVLKATNGRASFLPFSGGPRICLGQNFSLLEAKIAFSMILQRFTFELSPSYAHAPFAVLALYPQYGAHVILRKVEL